MRLSQLPRLSWIVHLLVACGRFGTPPMPTARSERPDEAASATSRGGSSHEEILRSRRRDDAQHERTLANAAGSREDARTGTSTGAAARDADDDATAARDVQPGSRRVLASATVFSAPDPDSAALAIVAAGTRVAIFGSATGAGCREGWLEVAPRGFLCAPTEASNAAPSSAILPVLPKGAVVPGVYGKVADDAEIFASAADAARGVGGHRPMRKLTVSRLGREVIGGRAFWRTSEGLIAESQIRRHRGSKFAGVALDAPDAPALPFAWVLARPGADRSTVAVHAAPRAGAKIVTRLAPRTIVSVGASDHGFVDVGEGWVALADLRIAAASSVPEGVQDGEHWIDIDLDQQVLVAYEGETAMYATMVSSGRVNHRTPTGVFRIERKIAERTMNSMADSDEEYRVDKVPWTAYFAKGYALHAAYWHDGFGRAKSHGCVNLSPKDARALYGFVAPAAAPGYSEVFGHEAQPGSVVRVRNRRDPDPTLQGYAKTLHTVAGLAIAG